MSADFGAFWRILADFGVKTPILAFIMDGGTLDGGTLDGEQWMGGIGDDALDEAYRHRYLIQPHALAVSHNLCNHSI